MKGILIDSLSPMGLRLAFSSPGILLRVLFSLTYGKERGRAYSSSMGVKELLCFSPAGRAKWNGLGVSRLCHQHENRLVTSNLLFSLSQAGCSHDPKIRKQRFLVQGDQAFQKGQFSAAAICYGQAIEIDPRFTETHFKLAQTSIRMSSWMAACQEFRRTVELQPENWQAQLSLCPWDDIT